MKEQHSLGELLAHNSGEVFAVVGCGGKSAFIELAAHSFAGQKVLVMPSTRIGAEQVPQNAPGMVCTTLVDCLAHAPAPGVQYLGVLDEKLGKLLSPPPAHWPRLSSGYDLVLAEADGSRGLPCKGWRQNEPVIPIGTTRTLGLISTAGLGLPVGEETVLRPDAFAALTGLHPGDAITLDALAQMVGGKQGMFKGSQGEAWLFINQVESEEKMAEARVLASAVRRLHPSAVARVFAGSVFQNRWFAV